jgi:hypothetical protein
MPSVAEWILKWHALRPLKNPETFWRSSYASANNPTHSPVNETQRDTTTVQNTTGSQPTFTNKRIKTFKRGRWIKVTKGPYAGTKRWLSAESRTKLSANTYANKPWNKKNKPKGTVDYVDPKGGAGEFKTLGTSGTGTTVRLSQETATLLTNSTEGLSIAEAVDYILNDYYSRVLSDGTKLIRKNYIKLEVPPKF